MEEDITRIRKELVVRLEHPDWSHPCWIVADAEILLENGDEHQHAKIGLRILVFGSVGIKAVYIAVGFHPDASGEFVKAVECHVYVQLLGPAKPLSAEEIHERYVQAFELVRLEREQSLNRPLVTSDDAAPLRRVLTFLKESLNPLTFLA